MTTYGVAFEISLLPDGQTLYEWKTNGKFKIWVKNDSIFEKYKCDRFQAPYIIQYFFDYINSNDFSDIIYYDSLWYKNGIFFAEIGFKNDVAYEQLTDDEIEHLLLPTNRSPLYIQENMYILHYNLCYYTELDDDMSIDLCDDFPEKTMIIHTDDCCEQNCDFYNYRFAYSWLSTLLSYVFSNTDKAVNNKNNENA